MPIRKTLNKMFSMAPGILLANKAPSVAPKKMAAAMMMAARQSMAPCRPYSRTAPIPTGGNKTIKLVPVAYCEEKPSK